MRRALLATLFALPSAFSFAAPDQALKQAIASDYSAHLGSLFEHLHRHPELSFMETKTAARMARELGALATEGKVQVISSLAAGTVYRWQ